MQRHSHSIAGYVVERFSGDIADLVSSTVERWDTEETSQRIELQVGRDLQWIRVNGTVVGGLAGLVIYTVAQLHRLILQGSMVTLMASPLATMSNASSARSSGSRAVIRSLTGPCRWRCTPAPACCARGPSRSPP